MKAKHIAIGGAVIMLIGIYLIMPFPIFLIIAGAITISAPIIYAEENL